jgi:hypothetical protein
MHCLVTASKHVNNTRAITRQLLDKRVTVATNTLATVEVLLDYKNGNGVFYVVRAEVLYAVSRVPKLIVGSWQLGFERVLHGRL